MTQEPITFDRERARLQNIAKNLKSGATLVLADLHGDRESNFLNSYF